MPQAPYRVDVPATSGSESGGTVTIHIGRVEVRAERPADRQKVVRRGRAAPDFMSLEDHLAGKERGQ